MNKRKLGETLWLFKKRYCRHASPKSYKRTNINQVSTYKKSIKNLRDKFLQK